MVRRRVGIAVLCAALLASTGCAATGPDSPAVQEWMDAETERLQERPGVAVVMTSRTASGASVDEAGSISSAFPEPLSLAEIEFACSGGGQTRVRVTLTTPDGGGSMNSSSDHGPFSCGGQTHVVPLAGLAGAAAAVDIDVAGFGATVDGAWSAAVIQDIP